MLKQFHSLSDRSQSNFPYVTPCVITALPLLLIWLTYSSQSIKQVCEIIKIVIDLHLWFTALAYEMTGHVKLIHVFFSNIFFFKLCLSNTLRNV